MAQSGNVKRKKSNSRSTNNSRRTANRTNSKSNKRTNKRTKEQVYKTAKMKQEVILLVSIAVCILLFLSNLNIGGSIGHAVSNFMFGLWGIPAFIFPIYLLILIFFIVSNIGNSKAYFKAIMSFILLLLICLLCELTKIGADVSNLDTALDSYKYSGQYHTGGGLVGGGLASLLIPSIGTIGTWVVDLIAIIISCVLISEKSFLDFLKVGGNKIKNSTEKGAEELAALKEEQEKRRSEKEANEKVKKRRSEMTAEGVTLDTVVGEQKSNNDKEDIREIVFDENSSDFDDSNIEKIRVEGAILNKEEDIPNINSSESDVFDDYVPEPISREDEYLITDVKEIYQEVNSSEKSYDEEEIDLPEPVEHVSDIPEDNQNSIEQENIITNDKYMNYQFPPLSLLKKPKVSKKANNNSLMDMKKTLQLTLTNFGVNAKVSDNVSRGPAVTRFEIEPEMGTKVSKIINLADDIKLNLAVADIRIEAPIPGKAAVGIEVPNKETEAVSFSELVDSDEFRNNKSKISFAAGRDIAGNIVMADIAKMPHVLIAGATGSGKSVCINTIIMSILFNARPDEVKLIMIDPKVVELSVYNGIPHLLIPVVTEPKKAAGALNWAVAEMDRRYRLFAEYEVRDMKGFNEKVEMTNKELDPEKAIEKMPQIVVIVDELADLMMVAPGDVETAICRLAQLARAAGIHLVIATQRPSVNVITGLIKANMPSRIAFAVTSGVDSRTILDMNGAEKLLGKGDMLYFPQNLQKPLRVQGAFVTDEEVSDVVKFLKENNKSEGYDPDVQNSFNEAQNFAIVATAAGNSGNDRDNLFEEVGRFLIESEKGSIGVIQRKFKVGFNRAARIMDQLQEAGVVGPEEGTKPRKILMNIEEFEQMLKD